MANSDIIKIGFDYRASLEQFEKETNGVFDGISDKAGKQKITIQLDAKDDKVIDKIKELQKLKLDKFTFEFGDSGLKEQLQTFDKLENKINEIINLSKGIDLSFNTKNKTEAYNQLKKYSEIFKDFYDNEEKMFTEAGTKAGYAYYKAYEEALEKGVARSKLERVTIDYDKESSHGANGVVSYRTKEYEDYKKYGNESENELLSEISSLESRLLNFNSAYSQVKANLGEAPITPYIIENIENYVRFLEVAENRLKDINQFGNILDDDYTDEDYKSDKKLANVFLDSALSEATRQNEEYTNSLKEIQVQTNITSDAEKELKSVEKELLSTTSSSNDSQIEELKADITEVKTELGDVKDRISSIESNGFENVREDVEKTKESVKELNSELAEMKSNLSSTPQESNISSDNSNYKSMKKGVKLEYFDGYTDKYDASINSYEQNVVRVVETTDKFAVDAEMSCAKAETAVQKFINSIGEQFPGLQSELNSIRENMSELSDLQYSDGANSFGFEPTSDGKGWYVYLNVLKDVQEQAEKTTQAVKEVSSTASQDQKKDAFPDKDISASVESATNSIKEENNVLEQNTQKVKENTQAKEQNANVNLNKYDKRLDSYNGKVGKYQATINRFNDGGWTSDTYLKNVQAVRDAVKQYATLLDNIKTNQNGIASDEDIQNLDKYEKKIKDTIATVTNMSASEKGYTKLAGQKEIDKINQILRENSAMSSEAKAKIKAYKQELISGNPSVSLEKIHGEIMKIVNAEELAGRAGRSFFDTLKNSGFHQIAAQMAGMFGVYDVINVIKQAASTVTELNTQITELAKVSEQSSKQIYADFDSYADIAKEVRGTISDTIAATADWSKNGYSIPDSKQLAEISQLYKNVGDGIDIDAANESLISTLKGFQLEADQAEHIVDVFNEVSNNEAISSGGIGEALQRSAASFNAASTSLEKSVSLVTATNSVLQDPEKVGKQILAYLYSNVMKIKVAISVKPLRRARPRKDYNV